MIPVLDVLDRGVVVLDPRGAIQEWNAWMADFSQISTDHMLGRPIGELFNEEDGEGCLLRAVRQAREYGRSGSCSAALHGSPLSSPRAPLPRHTVAVHAIPAARAPFGVVLELWDTRASDRVEESLRRSENRVYDLERQLRRSEASRREILEVDPVTGLANRRQIHDYLVGTVARCVAEDRIGAVFQIDIDGFKRVNEAIGRSAADQVLRDVARRLGGLVRNSDTVARVGADEFVMILDGLDAEEDAETTARRVTACFEKPFLARGEEVFLTASLGAALFPMDGAVAETVLRNVEAALYSAREDGGAGYRLFTPEMTAQSHSMLKLRSALHRAVEQEGFSLAYQPQVDVKEGRVIGVEALLRWDRPDQGLLSPGTFVPVLEDIGLIERVGEWVLREACARAAAWQELGCELRVSVNVSARQMRKRRLINKVRRVLKETGLPGSALELEITESCLIQDVDHALAILHEVREMGVRVAVDDFGTGYSSLMYLRRFPIDTLKIDRAFISNVADDAEDAAICATIIRLGDTLGLDVLAEGVETIEQLNVVEKNGGHLIQGYYLGRPLPLHEFEAWVQRDPRLTVTRPASSPDTASVLL